MNKAMRWEWDYSECLCGAIQKNCSACDGLGMVIVEKKEVINSYPQYDDICRQCKEETVNHTKWLCDKCGKKAIEWYKKGK